MSSPSRPAGGRTRRRPPSSTASDGLSPDQLGWSVATDGATIVAGAPYHTVGTNFYQGAVYVFQERAGGWADTFQSAELVASDGAQGDLLGGSVGISGDTVVAGAIHHQVGANGSQGAVYVFVEPAGGWQDAFDTAELTASDGAANDELGGAVAISGATIVAGAKLETSSASAPPGAVYVFTQPAAGWVSGTQTGELAPADDPHAALGVSVAVSGATILGGAVAHTVGSVAGAGAVDVFGGAAPSTAPVVTGVSPAPGP